MVKSSIKLNLFQRLANMKGHNYLYSGNNNYLPASGRNNPYSSSCIAELTYR